jgi:hypothetical protein
MASDVESPQESNERFPCSDEMCTGVLDARGVCGTCGKAGAAVMERVADEDADGVGAAEAAELTSNETEPEAKHEESEDRVPCPDDMCTGVLDADGRCGTCGKTAPRP